MPTKPKWPEKEGLSTLLDASDLPGDGWLLRFQRTWQTGHPAAWAPNRLLVPVVKNIERNTNPPSEEAIRAGQAGSASAQRMFRKGRKGLRARLIPLLSAEDAQLFMEGWPDRIAASKQPAWSRVLMRASQATVERCEVPGADDAWCSTQPVRVLTSTATVMQAAGHVGPLVFMVTGSSTNRPGAWSWDEVLDLARIQAQKLHQWIERSDNL